MYFINNRSYKQRLEASLNEKKIFNVCIYYISQLLYSFGEVVVQLLIIIIIYIKNYTIIYTVINNNNNLYYYYTYAHIVVVFQNGCDTNQLTTHDVVVKIILYYNILMKLRSI